MDLDQDFSSRDIFTLCQKQNRNRITKELKLCYIEKNKYEHNIGLSFIKDINSPYTAEV
jgi:hypothetical protein